jgi:hypothetical protein
MVTIAWRSSSGELATNRVMVRVRDLPLRVSLEALADMASLTARLAYLTTDAAGVEYRQALSGKASLSEIFSTTAIGAIPSAFYPGKAENTTITCETLFESVGFDMDLPCTPTVEAYVTGGWSAIVLTALLLGLALALVEALMASRSLLLRIAGLHLLAPMTMIETSAFPWIQGIRVATTIVLPLALLSFFLSRVLRGRGRVPFRRGVRP